MFQALLANDGDGLQDKALNGGLLETANLRTQRTQRFRRGRRKPEDPSVFLASSAILGVLCGAALIEYLTIIRE